MASILQKRASGKILATILSVVAALQGATPCFARCHAARVETAAAPQAVVPACHAPAPTEQSPIGSLQISAESHSSCCCLERPSERAEGEASAASAVRSASSAGFDTARGAGARLLFNAPICERSRIHGDRSPPPSQLFIAYHSLRI